jgi:hypothetical protein
MSDRVVAQIDALIKEHEAALTRLREFRTLYLKSPDLQLVISSLVGSERGAAHMSNGASNGTRGATATPFGRGTTEAVLTVVKQKPGIEAAPLIDEVLKLITPTAKKPRRAIASTYEYLRANNRLIKREGRFYPVGGQ